MYGAAVLYHRLPACLVIIIHYHLCSLLILIIHMDTIPPYHNISLSYIIIWLWLISIHNPMCYLCNMILCSSQSAIVYVIPSTHLPAQSSSFYRINLFLPSIIPSVDLICPSVRPSIPIPMPMPPLARRCSSGHVQCYLC